MSSFFAALLVAQARGFSAGCDAATFPVGRRQAQVMQVGPVLRSYTVTVPSQPGPKPVLFAYHGYTNDAKEIADEHNFDQLAEKHGFIVVYAQGMADGSAGASWNLGAQTDAQCSAPEPGSTVCYDSCKPGCGACHWHTCVDDLQYADALVAQVAASTCVDLQRLYLYGESAGAMFTYRLLGERPGVYAAAAPEQGLPYAHKEAAPGRWPAILHLHDRQDTTVPLAGGRSDDGWLYASLAKTLQGVCGGTTKTPYESKLPKVECTQYLGCKGGPVVACLYDGEHGHLPDGVRLKDGAEKAGLSDDFIWEFLAQFRASGVSEMERVAARWERLAFAGLLAAVFISAAAMLLEHQRRQKLASGEECALLGPRQKAGASSLDTSI